MDTRRDFIKQFTLSSAVGLASGCKILSKEGFDDSLSILISDLHIGGANPKFDYTKDRLTRVVDEILAMRPLPRRVICFGDVALTYGLEADYVASKPILKRLVDAGIELHLTMGNHDRRSFFFKHWPEYTKNPLVPGRCTQVVSLGAADLVLLDTLKGADNRPENDMGPVDGTIDDAQLKWFESFVEQAKRPFLVGSHQFRDLHIKGESAYSRAAKSDFFSGWIFGHEHSWCPDILVASWKLRKIVPTLIVPSTGLWGDIGYVLFRADANGATASLVQSDFYFQASSPNKARPEFWDVRVKENQGKTTRFVFERA